MRKPLMLLAFVALSGCSRDAATPVGEAHAQTAGAPVVVELFQSQGCSSCPPANANVNALSTRADVLALSFAVTYWDRLGWKDTFAKPAYTERQRAYAQRGQSDGVYTPQVVINGAKALVGANRAGLDRAVAAAGPVGGPAILRKGDGIDIAAGQGAPAAVLLVTYDPRVLEVPVKAGENSGRTLPHRNVVTELREIGTWSGKAAHFAAPAPKNGALRTAILLQQGAGGKLVGAAKL